MNIKAIGNYTDGINEAIKIKVNTLNALLNEIVFYHKGNVLADEKISLIIDGLFRELDALHNEHKYFLKREIDEAIENYKMYKEDMNND